MITVISVKEITQADPVWQSEVDVKKQHIMPTLKKPSWSGEPTKITPKSPLAAHPGDKTTESPNIYKKRKKMNKKMQATLASVINVSVHDSVPTSKKQNKRTLSFFCLSK